ncbi:MAG: ChpI protein [Pseudomonadota bacterium]|nr:ChpI protein [Pseudomonadota bacterium]
MKVAISLPDPLFIAAERLAQRLRVSRSQLYAQALQEYMVGRDDARVTEQLDAVYDAIGPSMLDPALAAAQARMVDDEAW